ncbi:MAG TPA: 3-dehydroquinate synthase [Planctomycetota bacterium]|nr:3-dehydroquinate synthase [Planctomycetota bacterium]
MTLVGVEVELAPAYTVHIGPGALDLARASFANEKPRVLISDARVHGLHGRTLDPKADARLALLPEGEAAKDFEHLASTLEFLAQQGLDRRSCVWTLGGGAVGDLGGLAAALYMRGVAVVHCPTTLLAQVDASVGGKTAVNLGAGKNLAGAFHQPRAVYADTRVLATLEESEYRSGLGEVVKTALVAGGDLLGLIEREADRLAARDPGLLSEVVEACVRTKARIVAADPMEAGARKALNLGHTFAHAIEQSAGFGKVAHGVAVGVGIAIALRAAREMGCLDDRELEARVRRLLLRLNLLPDLASLRRSIGRALEPRELVAAMRHDKKSRGGELQLVLPRAAGKLELSVAVDGALIESWLA